jgi:hypothetical protein
MKGGLRFDQVPHINMNKTVDYADYLAPCVHDPLGVKSDRPCTCPRLVPIRKRIEEKVPGLHAFLKKYKLPLVAASFYLLVSLLDVVSSMGHGSGFEELNPFTRDLFHKFILSRGIAVKLVAIGAFSGVSAALYQGFKSLDERLGLTAASLPFYYYGIDALLNGVIPNFLIHLGWYVR